MPGEGRVACRAAGPRGGRLGPNEGGYRHEDGRVSRGGHHASRGRRRDADDRHQSSRRVGGGRRRRWRRRAQDLDDLPRPLVTEGTRVRSTSAAGQVAAGRGGVVTSRSGWAQGIVRRRCALASSPTCRMRTTPRGSTWTRTRRRHASTPSVRIFVCPRSASAKPPDASVSLMRRAFEVANARGVATEILEHLRRPPKRPLGVDNPRRRAEGGHERRKPGAIGEGSGSGGEDQVAGREGAVQAGEIRGAEDEREGLDRKQKRHAPADPARAIARQGAAGDDAVDRHVKGEGLPPRVEDGGDTDRPAEIPRIAAECEQRVGCRAEQARGDHARIAVRERLERCRRRPRPSALPFRRSPFERGRVSQQADVR